MYKLTVLAPNGAIRYLAFDAHRSTLIWADTGETVDLAHLDTGKPRSLVWREGPKVHPIMPGGKTSRVKRLKIQLGLKCNYACSYCSQAHQPHDSQGSPADVEPLMAMIRDNLVLDEAAKIEFWGGEPLVYLKTLRPLVLQIRREYPKASLGIVTNGSLFDEKTVDFLVSNGFSVTISHDGPAHKQTRGPDPFDDPVAAHWIRVAYNRLAPIGRISFNAVFTPQMDSVQALRTFLADKLMIPVEYVPANVEGVIVPYDAAGSQYRFTGMTGKRLVHRTFYEAVTGGSASAMTIVQAIQGFTQSLINGRPSSSVGQKCGMDQEDHLAIDMAGNVVTCQNVSADTYHRIGHMTAMEEVQLDTSTHWAHRPACVRCPMVQLCQGACMFLEGPLFDAACDNMHAYTLGLFAAAIFFATKGWVVVAIEGENMRARGVDKVSVIDPEFAHKGPEVDWMKPKTRVIPIAVAN